MTTETTPPVDLTPDVTAEHVYVPMNPEVRALWLDALRGDEYVQGQGRLVRADGSFCCLGVLCDLYRKGVGGEWKEITKDGGKSFFATEDDKSAHALPKAVVEWAGLTPNIWSGEGSFTNITSILMRMNDEGGTPFTEIADYIEKTL